MMYMYFYTVMPSLLQAGVTIRTYSHMQNLINAAKTTAVGLIVRGYERMSIQ